MLDISFYEKDELPSDGIISDKEEQERDTERVSGKRRRTASRMNRFDFDELGNKEQELLQKALKNSRRETKRVEVEIPMAPTFHPTVEEFRDPLTYILSIRESAEKFGICKIVPPPEWDPPLELDLNDTKTKLETKLQEINTLQEGKGFPEGKSYALKDYREMAENFEKNWAKSYYNGKKPTMKEIMKDYWDMVETGEHHHDMGGKRKDNVSVEYANDIDTTKYLSGFPRPLSISSSSNARDHSHSGVEPIDSKDMFTPNYYKRTAWNINNMPKAQGSLLKHLDTPINGINVPWLYCGMQFATFCWHNEDNYMYSVNYCHMSSSYGKQWYGIPGAEATKFERLSKDWLFESFNEAPDLLHHMTTQISPYFLSRNNVPVYQVLQEAKTFVITFPKAFHGGFSYGFNIGEAVNFATADWLAKGSEAELRYRHFGRPAVFSHVRLLFTLVVHINDIDFAYRLPLLKQIEQVCDEELRYRPIYRDAGITMGFDLPSNEFSSINEDRISYDEMRTCEICKCVCVFSAVACKCSQSKVSCLRHQLDHMCKCPKDQKYTMSWASDKELIDMRSKVRASIRVLEQG